MNWRTDEEQAETASGRRISLPEPDVENITVLTKSLPNEPILPWHHFDSPWLERDEDVQAGEEAEASETESGDPPAAEVEAATPAEPALKTTSEDSAALESPTADASASEAAADSEGLEQLALALEVPEVAPEAPAPEAINQPAPTAEASPEHPEA